MMSLLVSVLKWVNSLLVMLLALISIQVSILRTLFEKLWAPFKLYFVLRGKIMQLFGKMLLSVVALNIYQQLSKMRFVGVKTKSNC